jgi:hypothetical protein
MRLMLRRAFPAVCALLLGSWPVAALAQADVVVEPKDQIVLRGDVVVPKGQVVGEVVVFSGTATVAGVVRGDVVVLDGPVTIGGQVSGDVVAIHGSIRLLRSAQVAGSVRGGGDIEVAGGAEVQGTVARGVRFTLSGPVGALGVLLASVAVAVSVLAMGLLMLLFAPRGVEGLANAGRERPFVAGSWGIALTLAVPLAAVAAGATILGLPIGLAVLLSVGLLWLLGIAGSTWVLGRALVREPRPRIAALAAGWAIGAAVGLVPILNLAWWFLGGMFGLGAIAVALWRARGAQPVGPEGASRSGRHRAGRATLVPATTSSSAPPATPLAED